MEIEAYHSGGTGRPQLSLWLVMNRFNTEYNSISLYSILIVYYNSILNLSLYSILY